MTERWSRYCMLSSLALACMMSAPMPTAAQDAKPAIAKWRPKEGTYAVPGKGFAETCGEFGDLIVGLRENDISGHEWGCKVSKLSDTAPGAIRIEMTCSDHNLAEDLKRPEETKFKEVILLRRIDDKSLLVRKTVDGKFKDPEYKAVYCPKKAQQMFLDVTAKSKAEAEQRKAAEKTAWQPRNGVYATPGADFDDRCMRSGDAVIAIDQASVSIGADSCHASHIWPKPPDTVELDVFCNQSGSQTLVAKTMGKTTTFEPAAESVSLSKIDDQSLLLRRSRNGQLTEFGKQLTYCPESAQRAYADSKKAK